METKEYMDILKDNIKELEDLNKMETKEYMDILKDNIKEKETIKPKKEEILNEVKIIGPAIALTAYTSMIYGIRKGIQNIIKSYKLKIDKDYQKCKKNVTSIYNKRMKERFTSFESIEVLEQEKRIGIKKCRTEYEKRMDEFKLKKLELKKKMVDDIEKAKSKYKKEKG